MIGRKTYRRYRSRILKRITKYRFNHQHPLTFILAIAAIWGKGVSTKKAVIEAAIFSLQIAAAFAAVIGLILLIA